MADAKDGREEKARADLVGIAADNGMYFVVWRGHFGNYLVGVRNVRKRLEPEIYSAIYESFYDLVGDDPEEFKIDLGEKFSWTDLLAAVSEEAVRQAVAAGKEIRLR